MPQALEAAASASEEDANATVDDARNCVLIHGTFRALGLGRG